MLDNINGRLLFLSTGLVGRFNSVVQSLPTSLNVSLIVDHLVDKLFDKGNRTDIDNTVAKDSRKAELIFLLNEVIRGKTFFTSPRGNSINTSHFSDPLSPRNIVFLTTVF